MFECVAAADLPAASACAVDELVDLLAAHARAEAFHTERKLAVAAELHRARCAKEARDQLFGHEPGEFVATEVAVALVGVHPAGVLLDLPRRRPRDPVAADAAGPGRR